MAVVIQELDVAPEQRTTQAPPPSPEPAPVPDLDLDRELRERAARAERLRAD